MQSAKPVDVDSYQVVPPNMGAVRRRGSWHSVDPNGNELFSHPDELVCIRWLIVGFGFDSVNAGQLKKYNESFLVSTVNK